MQKTILIVDDAESVAASLALAVESIPGMKPVVALHPHAALLMFRDSSVKIAAIITDLSLPALDGFELIRQLRETSGYENVPAIMITADEQASPNGNTLCKPNVIFRKPFSVREVCRVLEQLVT